jgi:hypothetical protein
MRGHTIYSHAHTCVVRGKTRKLARVDLPPIKLFEVLRVRGRVAKLICPPVL